MNYFYDDAEKYWNKLSSKKVRLLQEVPSFKRTQFFSVKQAIDDGYNPILFGLRRVGKTTILTQLMNERINDSIYLTFRDSYIQALSSNALDDLIEYIYSEKNIRLFLLDEVQLKNDWSDWLIQVIDSYPSAKFVITGSSTLNLEKRETGLDRTRKINIQTLSFGEYITITGKNKSESAFNEFLGNGFPKYALHPEETFDLQRSEIIDEILANDIPKDYPNVISDLITRLLYTIANLTNGEVNVSNLVRQVAPNFREREALEYISILEKAKILIKINRINSDLELPQRRKFKLYINPHIHLWLLDKKFSEVDSKAKGHIFESYWLHWALTINSSSKTFYYLKNESDLEIDFVSLEIIGGKKSIKTMHEFKLHSNKKQELELMKSLKAKNKLLWTFEGTNYGEIVGKSILDTFDTEI